MGTCWLCAALLVCLSVVVEVESSKRVCYYTSWSMWREPPADFWPEDIDPFLCTHVIFSFANMEGNQLIAWEDMDEELYTRLVALKDQNPNLKVMLAVGGWSFNHTIMSAMLSTEDNRLEFVESVINFLRVRNFDGFDLDFEYPGDEDRGSVPEDKFRYTFLVQELRQAFEEEADFTGQPRLLLSAAVPTSKRTVDNGYEIELLAREFDFISIMTYDLHGTWGDITGHHSALYPRDEETGVQAQLNVAWASAYWNDQGAPKDMLVIGMPTYARGWTLDDPDQDGFGAPASNPCHPGSITNSPGSMMYTEVCQATQSPTADVRWNEEHQCTYLVDGDQWLGYDDERSLTVKAEWLISEGFGGWMTWSLDQDDFKGHFCGGRDYPLLNTLKELIP